MDVRVSGEHDNKYLEDCSIQSREPGMVCNTSQGLCGLPHELLLVSLRAELSRGQEVG